MKILKRFRENEKARSIAIMGIIVAIITVAIGSTVGLALVSTTEDVFWAMTLGGSANTAFSDTVSTIYSSWPLLGLVVLALIGAGVLIAIAIIR